MQGKCLILHGMENAKNHLHNCRDWKMQGTENTSRKYGWQLRLPSFIIKLLNIRRIKKCRRRLDDYSQLQENFVITYFMGPKKSVRYRQGTL